jgi:dipeptidase E
MKIILSGGGKTNQTKKLDSLFFNLVKNGKVVFIPHSRKRKEFNDSLKWIKENMFSPYKHNNFEMWSDLKNKSIENFKDVKGIIIGGGNTFKLLKEIKDSNFLKILKKFIEKKGVVYGISAGAIILTKNIITAKPIDRNKVNLKNLEGMNLLNDYGIFCHYNPKYDKEIFNIVKNENMKIIGLPEGVGIYINGKTKKIIGDEYLVLFSKENKKEIDFIL